MAKNSFASASCGQEQVSPLEVFLCDNYDFRHNVLSDKYEFRELGDDDSKPFRPFTREARNTVIRRFKSTGIEMSNLGQCVDEYVYSEDTPQYDPANDWLTSLPAWDGKNHVGELFSRLPGITSEQLSWCSTWLRSCVAHWLGMDMLHGNECVPVLIGQQGCGKSTFAVRLLPQHLRSYFLDHINFGNKFDCDMALTHNLLVNIDEFANMGASQQGKLKQTLSKVKVNGRPIFGKAQEDRRRYASFLATTNDEHPLCDATGSRRYLCLRIRKGQLIDNDAPINYDQLYAQVLHELQTEHIPYWFTNDEVQRIQQTNLPYFKTDDMEGMITSCFHLPEENEKAEWFTCKEVHQELIRHYPSIRKDNSTKIRIGQTLKSLGCGSKRMTTGMSYNLVALSA